MGDTFQTVKVMIRAARGNPSTGRLNPRYSGLIQAAGDTSRTVAIRQAKLFKGDSSHERLDLSS